MTSSTIETPRLGVTPEMFQRNVPIEIERHSFGEHRKASMARVAFTTDTVEEQPDKALLSLRKRLIESPQANAIRLSDATFRKALVNELGSPWRPGFFFIPVGLVGRADDLAQRWVAERDRLADVAASVYTGHVEAMRDKLGALFNDRDYPTVESYRRSFWASYRFVDFGVPNLLRTVRANVFEREARKLEAEGREAANLIQQHLRATLLGITEHLAGLLTPKADGKLKTLRRGALDDLLGFLDTIQARNVTEDAPLMDVVANLRGLLVSGDVSILREDKALRAHMATIIGTAKEALEPLVVDHIRAIRFREDEDAA